MQSGLYQRDLSGSLQTWRRARVRDLIAPTSTTEDAQRCGEAYLEELIATDPTVIGVTSDENRSQIHGPFVCLRQVALPRISGGIIYPDVLVLCGSGDVIVVEVKLGDNPDLRGRGVIGQLLEYATRLSALDKPSLLEMVKKAYTPSAAAGTWEDAVEAMFSISPQAECKIDVQRLANQLLARFQRCELHLVIAADYIPPGLADLVDSVVSQTAVGAYRLQVAEIVPYVLDSSPGVVMFAPETRIETAIIGRTVVTVTYEEGQRQPGVVVQTTSLAELEAEERNAQRRGSARRWDEISFFDALSDVSEEATAALRRFCQVVREGGCEITYGKGRKFGTLHVNSPAYDEESIFTIYTDGGFSFNFVYMAAEVQVTSKQRLVDIGVILLPDSRYKTIYPEIWVDRIDDILQIVKAILARC